MERLDFEDFKVSIKSTNVPNTIAANRLLSERIPYPLHLGITEAGTKWSGSLKSAVGLGTLLADGIGDTIRISLSTFHAEEEVKVAWEILKALKLRERGPVLIACPTCGRLQFDMDTVVADIERRLEAYEDPVEVAVLGCAVNGIGEASHADFGITGAKNEGLIFSRGKPLRKVPQEQLVDELFKEIDKYTHDQEDRRRRRRAGRGRRVAAADRGGERRRADARAPRQARGREAARRGRRDGRGAAAPRRGRFADGRPPLHPRLTGANPPRMSPQPPHRWSRRHSCSCGARGAAERQRHAPTAGRYGVVSAADRATAGGGLADPSPHRRVRRRIRAGRARVGVACRGAGAWCRRGPELRVRGRALEDGARNGDH